MESGRIEDDNRLRQDDVAGLFGAFVFRTCAVQYHFKRAVFTGFNPAGTEVVADLITVRHHDLSQQAFGVQPHIIHIKLDQRITDRHGIALPDARCKTFAFQVHRIDTDVNHQLQPGVRHNRHGMAGRMNLRDFSGARSKQAVGYRINGNSVADQFLGEDRIRNILQSHQRPGQRCDKRQLARF
ncbi:MAG: hypothetical protein BWY83_03240 [bacterium ADurb.Bin478]|nr:MAG: hypothetical protein BWY83_03240 [bacterium ADurb.Bin478]